MTLLFIGLAASLAAFGGGLLAFRFRDHLHLVLGFSAGAVLAVAFFDLIPEAVALAGGEVNKALMVVFGAFLVYMILDRSLFLHQHTDEHCHNDAHDHNQPRGRFGALSLSVHSFLDGAAVGVAFQAAPILGLAVALAVFAHGFSDGINTVTVIRRHGGGKAEAFKWLSVDAAAPLLGVISTFFFTLPATALSFMLAIFAGFFIYLGASDLLPESHHGHQTHFTTLATVVGAVVVFTLVKILGV